MGEKGKMKSDKPVRLDDYLKGLRKALQVAQRDFWKDMRAAEGIFRKEMTAAMREYEKVAYFDKRVPGALTEAAKIFNERHDAAYRIFGEATKGVLQRLERKVEDLMGP